MACRVIAEIAKYADEAVAFVNAKQRHPHAPDFTCPVLEEVTTHTSGEFELRFSLPNYGEAIVSFENNAPCDYSLRD